LIAIADKTDGLANQPPRNPEPAFVGHLVAVMDG
jgi:hypothetical protein